MPIKREPSANKEDVILAFIAAITIGIALYSYYLTNILFIKYFYNVEVKGQALGIRAAFDNSFPMAHALAAACAIIVGVALIVVIFFLVRKKSNFRREKEEQTNDISKKDLEKLKKDSEDTFGIKMGTLIEHDSEYVITKQTNQEVVLPWQVFNTHLLMIAPTAMGKTTYLVNIINQIIPQKATLIAFDPKSDITQQIMYLAKQMGREKDLVILPDYGTNPLSLNNNFSLENIDNTLSRIITSVFSLDSSTEIEPFYKNMQEQYFLRAGKLVIAGLCEEPTLKDILRISIDKGYRQFILQKAKDNYDKYKRREAQAERHIIIRENYLIEENNYQKPVGIILKPKIAETVNNQKVTGIIGEQYKITEDNCLYKQINSEYTLIGKFANNKIVEEEIGYVLFEIIQKENIIHRYPLKNQNPRIEFEYYNEKLYIENKKLYNIDKEEIGYIENNSIYRKGEEIGEIRVKYNYVAAETIINAAEIYEEVYAKWSDEQYTKNIDDLRNRIAKIIEGEKGALYNQRNSKNLYNLINNNKIIIIRAGSADSIEKARGYMFMNMLQSTIMERSKYPKTKFPPTAVIIDEAHFFISDTFDTFITTCRSTNTGLLIAYQSTDQLEEEMSNVVFGNTSIKIVMGGMEYKTAEVFAKEMGYEYYVVTGTSKQQGGLTDSGGSISQSKELQFRIQPTRIAELPADTVLIKAKTNRSYRPPIYVKLPPPVKTTDELLTIYRTPIKHEVDSWKVVQEKEQEKIEDAQNTRKREEKAQVIAKTQQAPAPSIEILNNIKIEKIGTNWLWRNPKTNLQFMVEFALPDERDNANPNEQHIYKGTYSSAKKIKIIEITKRAEIKNIANNPADNIQTANAPVVSSPVISSPIKEDKQIIVSPTPTVNNPDTPVPTNITGKIGNISKSNDTIVRENIPNPTPTADGVIDISKIKINLKK